MTRKILFVDANIFMHFRFWNMDWKAIAGCDEVILEVSSITIAELDKHKDQHPRKGLRKRASSAINQLRKSIGANLSGTIGEGVQVQLSPQAPSIDLDAHGLSPSSPDDLLIGCSLARRNEGEKVAIATNDFGLEIKAMQRDIEVLRPPEKDCLPDVLSEEEKKILKLEAELQAERSRRPKLDLMFAESSERHVKLASLPPISITQNEIAAEMAGVKAKHAHYGPTYGDLLGPHPGWIQPFKSPIDEYNRELSEYYEKYEEYIPKRIKAENRRRASVYFEILLVNDGNTPALDVDVLLEFPKDRFVRVNETEPIDPPLRAPTPPKKPETRQFGQDLLEDQLSRIVPHAAIFSDRSVLEPPNISRNVEHEDGCTKARTHVRTLKHGMTISVAGYVHVPFKSHEEATSFAITFSILAGNVPQTISGKLNVVVDKKDSGTSSS
ncbi:MAG: PIN domain-containing protein [Planctomycetota bacterium]